MSSLKVVLLLGSVRETRLGGRVIKFITKQLEESGHDVTLFDPAAMGFPVVKQPLHFYEDPAQAPDNLKQYNKILEEADAFLIVTGEYNATIPPALTNMMDHFPPKSYSFKPTGIITYSPSMMGGCRATVALRAFLSELSTPTIPFSMVIPQAHIALSEDGVPNNEHLLPNATKLISHLSWYAHAMKTQRAHGIPHGEPTSPHSTQ